MNPTRPTDSTPYASEPVLKNQASFSTGSQVSQIVDAEETRTQEDWLCVAAPDPACWLTEVDH